MGFLFFLILVLGLPIAFCIYCVVSDRLLLNKCLIHPYNKVKNGLGKRLERVKCTIYSVGDKEICKDSTMIRKNPNAYIDIYESCIILNSFGRALPILDYSVIHYVEFPLISGGALCISMQGIPDVSIYLRVDAIKKLEKYIHI